MLARLCDAFQTLAVTRKNVDAQFLLQFNDGLGDAWLGGMKRFGSFGQIEISTCRFLNETELV